MKNIIFSLLLLSCSNQAFADQEDVIINGLTIGIDCEYNMPLTLDPDWDASQAEIIRRAAKQWEDTLGINIGELKYNSKNCGYPNENNWIKGCIVKGKSFNNIGCKFIKGIMFCQDNKGIIIFTDSVGNNILEAIALHEIGHYIGMSHIPFSECVMSQYGITNKVTKEDVLFYNRSCKKGI